MIQAVENQPVQANTKTKKQDKGAQNSFSDLLQNTIGISGKIKPAKDDKQTADAVRNSEDPPNTFVQVPQETAAAIAGISFISQSVALAATAGGAFALANAGNIQIQSDVPFDAQAQTNTLSNTVMPVQAGSAGKAASAITSQTSEDAPSSMFQADAPVQTAVTQVCANAAEQTEQNNGINIDVQGTVENAVSTKDTDKLGGFDGGIQSKTFAPEKASADFTKTDAGAPSPESMNNAVRSEKKNNGMYALQEHAEGPPAEWKAIKVSDEASEIKQPVTHQIAQKVFVNLKKDVSEFNMQLYPKDLGEISVKLISKNGTLTVELSAANTKTQELLTANADKIRDILESSQAKPVHVDCTHQEHTDYSNLNDQSSQSGKERQDQGGHSSQRNNEAFEAADKFLSFLEVMNLKAI